jgi:hypothetical protein
MDSECEECGVRGPHYVWSSCSRTAMDLTARMEERLTEPNTALEDPNSLDMDVEEISRRLNELVEYILVADIDATPATFICGHGMFEAARMEMACNFDPLQERENALLRARLCQDAVDGRTLEEMIHVHDEIDEEHLIDLVEQAIWGVEFDELDGPPPLLGDFWTERQDHLLGRLWAGPLESKIVARLCGRTHGAVMMRATNLRDHERYVGPWEAVVQQQLTPDQILLYFHAGIPFETMHLLHPEFDVQQLVETVEFAVRFSDHDEDGPEPQLHQAQWTAQRDDILVRLWDGPLHSRVIARLCGRSHRSVVLRATALRDAGEQMWFEEVEG